MDSSNRKKSGTSRRGFLQTGMAVAAAAVVVLAAADAVPAAPAEIFSRRDKDLQVADGT